MADLDMLTALFGDEQMVSGPKTPAPTTQGRTPAAMEGLLAMLSGGQGGLDVSESPTATQGPGGGKDDMIPAVIEDEATGQPLQEARLSPGEFVLKADTVSFLGDGDTNSGASLLNILNNVPEAADEVKQILRKYTGGE